MRLYLRMFLYCLQVYGFAALVFLGLFGFTVDLTVGLLTVAVMVAAAVISALLYCVGGWIDGKS